MANKASTAVEKRARWDSLDDLFGGWPERISWPWSWAPGALGDLLRVEEYREDSALVVRVEIAGIDPEKDVEITVSDGMLHISAERRQEEDTEGKHFRRREWRYGSFHRNLPLPEGCSTKDIAATYNDGILEIRLPTPVVKGEGAMKIPVSKG